MFILGFRKAGPNEGEINVETRMKMRRVETAFTLVELLTVIAIIAILAALLFPVLSTAKAKAQQARCLANLRQIGAAFQLYETDFDQRMPDRRDLKLSTPGGWKPWTVWPTSDPRCAWAAIVFQPYVKSYGIWTCPIAQALFTGVAQANQAITNDLNSPITTYWLWRFDRPDNPIPLDDFWGKSEEQAVGDLILAHNPVVGTPTGAADVELAVDPYFPSTIPTVPSAIKGKSTHFGGRERLFLDGHAAFFKDPRTNR